MERKMGFWTLEIGAKFKNEQEVRKLQKNIIDKFRYECNKHEYYMVQAIVGISNTNSNYVCGKYYKSCGKVGRPKKVKDIVKENDIAKITYGELHTDWHIHIFVLSSPSEVLARDIKKYVDKNWNVGTTYKKIKGHDKTYINIGMLFYIANQSDTVMFYGSGDNRFKYSFRNMYEASVKKYSYLKTDLKYISDEDYREAKDKAYNDMVNYFNGFCDVELKCKQEQEFMQKVNRNRYKK